MFKEEPIRLPPKVRIIRECNWCGKVFKSDSKFIRTCGICKHREDWKWGENVDMTIPGGGKSRGKY